MTRRTPSQTSTALGLAVAMLMLASAESAAKDGQAESSNRLSGIIGVGVGFVPEYEGADDYKFLALPAFDLRYANLYANFRDGVGIDFVQSESFEAGVGATYVRGRRGEDSPPGVGKVKNAIGSRIFARYHPSKEVSLTAGMTNAYGGTDGTLIDLTLGYRFRPAKHILVLPAVSGTWASGKHMERYFGINERQAARSGLREFDAKSGVKDVSTSLTTIYALSRNWHVSATGSLTRYLGDAADSPINQHKWQPAVILGVGYRF